jgi:hypothetical protein
LGNYLFYNQKKSDRTECDIGAETAECGKDVEYVKAIPTL